MKKRLLTFVVKQRRLEGLPEMCAQGCQVSERGDPSKLDAEGTFKVVETLLPFEEDRRTRFLFSLLSSGVS